MKTEKRARSKKIETVRAVRALIKLYKKEFGTAWQSAFISTASSVVGVGNEFYEGLMNLLQELSYI